MEAGETGVSARLGTNGVVLVKAAELDGMQHPGAMDDRRREWEPLDQDPMMRWAEAHSRAAVVAFALPCVFLLGVPWALSGSGLALVIPASIAFGLAIALVVRWFLTSIERERALDLPTRRMISEALERGQPVSDETYATLAAEMAAAQRRWINVLFPSIPATVLAVDILYSRHLERSLSQTIFDARGLGVVALVTLSVLYPLRA